MADKRAHRQDYTLGSVWRRRNRTYAHSKSCQKCASKQTFQAPKCWLWLSLTSHTNKSSLANKVLLTNLGAAVYPDDFTVDLNVRGWSLTEVWKLDFVPRCRYETKERKEKGRCCNSKGNERKETNRTLQVYTPSITLLNEHTKHRTETRPIAVKWICCTCHPLNKMAQCMCTETVTVLLQNDLLWTIKPRQDQVSPLCG